uniref:Ammonium transporter n=1 Tax=Helicotheca tamesis TaxID=374047 RepID=A0A7S2MF89_9STRA
MASTYDTCEGRLDPSQESLADTWKMLECIADTSDEKQRMTDLGVNQFYLIFAASLVFFMQAGFAMLCAGSVRIKNVQNTMLKNLLDACGASLGFYTIGYAFAFGGDEYGGATTFIGTSNFFLMDVHNYAFWLFQFAFAATAATIVAGTLAERCQMTAYLFYSTFLTGFVYPVIVHSIWSENGFLSAYQKEPLWGTGMIDLAGSGVVHFTGGLTALIATWILGPRTGRFYDRRGRKLDKPKPFPGHSVALQVLGAFILWFGWYGFNAGSIMSITEKNNGKIAALAAVNTTLSAASGCVAALFTNLIIKERRTGEATFNLIRAYNGCLAGLVSITAGCSVLEPWAAIVTGFTAGLLYLGVSSLLVRMRLDDAVDAIPVHMTNGMWGLISVGLLASTDRLQASYGRSEHPGWFYSWGQGSGDATLLGAQLCGILFIGGWVTVIMTPFFLWLNYLGWFRADSLEEVVGLDISYHGQSFGETGNDETLSSEYIDAYHRRKDEMTRRRSSRNRDTNGSTDDQKHSQTDSYTDEYPSGTVDRVVPSSEP